MNCSVEDQRECERFCAKGKIFVKCKKLLLSLGWKKVTWEKYIKPDSATVYFCEKEIGFHYKESIIHIKYSVYELIGVLIAESLLPTDLLISNLIKKINDIR